MGAERPPLQFVRQIAVDRRLLRPGGGIAGLEIINKDLGIDEDPETPRHRTSPRLKESQLRNCGPGTDAHREVYEEIQQSSGFLTEWAKQHRQIFVDHTAEQAKLIGEIVDKFPALSGAHKTSPHEADPWLIAMSICQGKSLTVVTEKSARPQKRKTPAACDHFGVPWMNGY